MTSTFVSVVASAATSARRFTRPIGTALLVVGLLLSLGCAHAKDPDHGKDEIYDEDFEKGKVEGREGDPLAEEDFEDGEDDEDSEQNRGGYGQ